MVARHCARRVDNKEHVTTPSACAGAPSEKSVKSGNVESVPIGSFGLRTILKRASVGLGVGLYAEPCQIRHGYCCIIGVWAEIVLGCLVPGRGQPSWCHGPGTLSLCWRLLYPAP